MVSPGDFAMTTSPDVALWFVIAIWGPMAATRNSWPRQGAWSWCSECGRVWLLVSGMHTLQWRAWNAPLTTGRPPYMEGGAPSRQIMAFWSLLAFVRDRSGFLLRWFTIGETVRWCRENGPISAQRMWCGSDCPSSGPRTTGGPPSAPPHPRMRHGLPGRRRGRHAFRTTAVRSVAPNAQY